MPPFGFFVDRVLGDIAERSDGSTIYANRRTRNVSTGGFIHEWHELVGKSRHGATNTNAAHVRAAADAGHPSPLRNITINHRTPTSKLHDAFGRAVDLREITLLVIAGAVATFVDGPAEQPRWTQLIVERNHGRQTRNLVEEIEYGLHKVVRLHGTSGHVHDRQSSLGPPIPAKIVCQSHAAGGISFHGVNAAVGSEGSDCNHR